MIKKSDLGAEVSAAGLLIGLLTPGDIGDTVNFNSDWFSDPISELSGTGTRLSDLVALLAAVLGPGATDPPPVFTDAQWYPIPNPTNGTTTGFQVVATAQTDASGQIGLGALYSINMGGITGQVYVYLPLFSYDPTMGAELILGSQQHPCQVGLYITSPTPFQVQDNSATVTFTAINLEASIYLNPQAYEVTPSPQFIKLEFENLTGTSKPSVYTSLASLLDPDVDSWLLQVLIQSGTWLNVYAGNSTFTIGDILEAASFLSRDYLFQDGNFPYLESFIQKLTAAPSDQDPVSAFLWSGFSAADQATLQDTNSTPAQQTAVLIAELNKVVQGGVSIYTESRFAEVALSPQTSTLLAQNPQGADLIRLNRLLLQDAYKVEIAANPYQLNLTNLHGSASDIALNFLFAVLNALSLLGVPLIDLPGGGIYITALDNKDGTQDFGLRLVLDIPLTSDKEGDGGGSNGSGADESNGGSASPVVDLCLGTWLTGEDDANNWMKRAGGSSATPAPGVSVFALHRDSANALSFAPSFALVSIGLNIKGGVNAPLINLGGYTLNGTDLRIYLNPGDPVQPVSQWQYGFAIRADDLGFPLAPNTGGGAGSNPVAQNFLSSGSNGQDANTGGDAGKEGAGADTEPINPTFSAAVAWRSDSDKSPKVNVQLFGADESPTDTAWLPIQRAFGPLHCQRLGINWPQENPNLRLSVLFDGFVTLGPLEVDLIDLSIGIPLKTPGQIKNYSLDLRGLSISYESGPLSISGGLMKNTDATPTEYDGEALIQAEQWSLSAMGSYASLNGHPSLFVFVRLGATIGGPPFFFVTGICAGFGYNRSLRIPGQDEVPNFPLLAGIGDVSKIGGEGATPTQALEKLSDWVQPAQGVNWFCAGVQFTSFELVQSNVVLAVIVTGDFEAAILGLSRVKLPQVGPEQFAYVELGIEIVIHPSAGFFGASAVITPNSYVLVPACHLTGGFAFYIWFAAPKDGDADHAGDFVITLGGYHPAFVKPEWYPDEARLGFSWQVSDNLTMQGGAYFALTPSCVMGGGALDLEFHAGNLRAWFTAHANFLFHWKPFYFKGSIGVSIGASYKLNLAFCSVTITVELGADLEIWGPPTAGVVTVDLFVVSFSIPFGPHSDAPAAFIQWDEFSQLLPQKDSAQTADGDRALKTQRPDTNAQADPPDQSNVCKLIINDGLISLVDDSASQGGQRWLVRADTFTFTAQTAFPLTEADTTNDTVQIKLYPQSADPTPIVAVRPMGIASSNVSSKMLITVQNAANQLQDLTLWNGVPVLGAVPAALWGEPEASQPAGPTANTLSARFLGLSDFKPPQAQPYGPPPIPIINLAYDPIDEDNSDYLPLSESQAGITLALTESPTSLETIADTIATETVILTRTAVFDALAAFGYDAVSNGTTAEIGANVNLNFPDAPLLGAPWQNS